MTRLFALGIPVYVLDQVTKWAILRASGGDYDWMHVVVPNWFALVYWQNTGAAFSLGDGNNGFFIALSAIALVALVVAYARGFFADGISRTAAGLLLGGILGNLTDRILHGHVVDFLLVDLHVRFADPWPAFNVADSAICIAAGLLVIGSFAGEKRGSDRDSAVQSR